MQGPRGRGCLVFCITGAAWGSKGRLVVCSFGQDVCLPLLAMQGPRGRGCLVVCITGAAWGEDVGWLSTVLGRTVAMGACYTGCPKVGCLSAIVQSSSAKIAGSVWSQEVGWFSTVCSFGLNLCWRKLLCMGSGGWVIVSDLGRTSVMVASSTGGLEVGWLSTVLGSTSIKVAGSVWSQ